MATMEAQILSKKLVKPSAPTPCHLQTMKLSLIDQIIPPTYINMVFYYSPAGDQDSREKSKARVTQLEESLSEALTKFYPLAGRLVMEDLLVDCNDQGVDDLCSMVSGSFREARKEKLYNHRVDVHLCASWCELPLHEADFGWGKPIWVSSTSQPYEVVSLIDNKFGCGIEAWVSLNEKDMLGFERDPDILAFSSQ